MLFLPRLPPSARDLYIPPMIGLFSNFAKSWVASAIMGLLMLTFLLLGNGSVRDMLRFHVADAVVQAGSRVVTSEQFQKRFNSEIQDYEQRTQQVLTPDQAVEQGADQDLLSGLTAQTAYSEMLARSGVHPSDAVVAAALTRAAQSGQQPELAQLFNSVTGKFDPQMLANLLRSTGQTQDEFQAALRDSVANQEFGSAISTGFHQPRIYTAILGALALESRDVTYFVIPLAGVQTPPAPSDAQLSALLQQNRDRYMLPERRKLTIVRFSAKALAPSMTVDPAAVQQQFQAKEASYGKPETRTFVEIPLNDPRTAPTVQARLARGEDPNAVAKSVGVDAVSYAEQPQSAIADRKAAAAAFAMHPGEVSAPLQGDFKTVILKLIKVTPGQAPSLETARPQIEADMRQQQAVDKVYELSQKFEDAHQGGANVAAAAAKVGAAAISVGPVTADGKDIATGQPNPMLSDKLLKTAFGLPQGGDSDVEQDADKGEYYAVHVDQVLPPSPPALDEKGVRESLTRDYLQQQVLGALQNKALKAQAAIQKGESMEAAAAAAGGHVTHQLGLRQITASQYAQTLGQQFLQGIFQVKAGQVFIAGSDALKGMVVARLDAVHPADPSQVASVLPLLGQRGDEAYLQGLYGAVHTAALKMIKPRTDLALARTAIGVDAATIAKLSAKPGAKGAGLAK